MQNLEKTNNNDKQSHKHRAQTGGLQRGWGMVEQVK